MDDDLFCLLHKRSATWSNCIESKIAPEEADRVPMRDRGVSLRFLHVLVAALTARGREHVDSGQLLNGEHTTSSVDDWEHFDRDKDAFCLKALTLHTGTSFVETCMDAGLVEDGDRKPFFGKIKAFASYSWRGIGVTFANLVSALEGEPGSEDMFYFIDVLVCAQHRLFGTRLRPSGTCPNKTDVGMFEHVISHCNYLHLYATPITEPIVLGRAWCLYEVMSALKLKKQVTVVLSHKDQAQLASLLTDNFDAIVTAFTRINSAAATATEPRDMEMIKDWIIRELTHGFKTIDEEVANQLRTWLVAAAGRIVHDRPEDDSEKAKLLCNSARLLLHLARSDEAQAMYERALAINEKALGKDHPETAVTLSGFAGMLERNGDDDLIPTVTLTLLYPQSQLQQSFQ